MEWPKHGIHKHPFKEIPPDDGPDYIHNGIRRPDFVKMYLFDVRAVNFCLGRGKEPENIRSPLSVFRGKQTFFQQRQNIRQMPVMVFVFMALVLMVPMFMVPVFMRFDHLGQCRSKTFAVNLFRLNPHAGQHGLYHVVEQSLRHAEIKQCP